MRDPGVDLLPVAAGKDHMSLRLDLVGGSIGTEGDGRLIRGAVTIGIVGHVLKKIEQPADAIELRMMGTHRERASPNAGIESHVGSQDHDSRLRVKAGAGCAAGGLGQPEFDLFRGAGEPRLLVEHQARGLDVDRTPAFAILRRGLTSLRVRSRGSLKIDLDFTHGAGNAMDWIPIEVAAIDAVGWRSLRTIQGDAYVVQFGVAVALELHRLGGVQGVNGVAAPRLRIGEAVGGLLDGRSQSVRQVMAQTAPLPSPIDEKSCDGGNQDPGEDQDPGAQACWRHPDFLSRSTGLGRTPIVSSSSHSLRLSAAGRR